MNKKNILIAICTALAIALLIALLCHMDWSDKQNKARWEDICENSTTTAVVKEKHTREHHCRYVSGTIFLITVKHEAIFPDGEKTEFTKDYKIPWEDYIQIEVGDTIITNCTYAPYFGPTWSYVTYEKSELQEE